MNLVIFDLETTGLSPYSNEIIQIAGVRIEAGRWSSEAAFFETFVRPSHSIPRHITHLTGITNADVGRAPGASEALKAFSQFAGDATLIAHNGHRFDVPFIRESCLRHQLPVRETGFADSMNFSRKIWGGRGGHGLDAVMSRLGLSAGGHRRHDARGDVRILAEAVRRMWDLLSDDFEMCPVGCGRAVMPATDP